jgi:hypothetical protein
MKSREMVAERYEIVQKFLQNQNYNNWNKMIIEALKMEQDIHDCGDEDCENCSEIQNTIEVLQDYQHNN